MAKEESKQEEVSRLRILNEIYKTENENIKREYRILFDKYTLEKNKGLIRRVKNKLRSIIKRG